MHPYGFLKVGAYMPCHRISQWSGLPDCDCLELSVHSAAAVSYNRCKLSVKLAGCGAHSIEMLHF